MIVDANLWISRAVRTDVHHMATQQWIAAHIQTGTRLVIPALALAEIAGAVARISGLSPEGLDAVQRLRLIPSLHVMPLDMTLFYRATRLAALLRLRGADSVYVAVAEVLGLPLVTWDRELAQRAGTVITVLHP